MNSDESFSSLPLAQLLGIRPGMNISTVNTPPDFVEALLPLPVGACFVDSITTGFDVQIFFATKKEQLIYKLAQLVRAMAVTGVVWIIFPTVAISHIVPSEDFVRFAALEMGLEDTKKLFFRPKWIGLKFQWRFRVPRPEVPQAQA